MTNSVDPDVENAVSRLRFSYFNVKSGDQVKRIYRGNQAKIKDKHARRFLDTQALLYSFESIGKNI